LEAITRGVQPLFSWAARRPVVYAIMTALGARLLAMIGGRDQLIHRLPLGGGWMDGRDLPAPEGKTFRELYGNRSRP